jgi:hypothetical protein
MDEKPVSVTLLYWLVGAMFSIFLLVVGLINSIQDGRIRALELYGSPALRDRIGSIEATLRSNRESLIRIEEQQERIREVLLTKANTSR